MAMKRRVMKKKQSKSVFRKGTKVHKRNVPTMPMRGGIRL